MAFFNLNRNTERTISLSNEYDVLNFLNGLDDDEYISADFALRNSDIYSIVFLLSMDLANCEFKADKGKYQALLNKPTQTANPHGFWESMFAQLLLDGNAYAYRWRNQNGTDNYSEYLRPSQVEPMLLEDGSSMVYNISFDEPEIGFMQNVPQSDMIHFRLMSRNGGKTGISPLTALINEAQIQDQSNSLTKNALNRAILSPGVLSVTHGGLLSQKEKAARSRNFMRQVNNSNGGPIVLDDLETYTPLEMKADVAKLLAQVDWTTTQIAKVYGVPDSYLNGQGDQQSSLTMIQGFYSNALNRYAQVIASELNFKLNANIKVNIRPAVDPNGDTFATILAGMDKDGVLTNSQVVTMLENINFFPDKVPEPLSDETQPALEGGETNGQDTSQG